MSAASPARVRVCIPALLVVVLTLGLLLVVPTWARAEQRALAPPASAPPASAAPGLAAAGLGAPDAEEADVEEADVEEVLEEAQAALEGELPSTQHDVTMVLREVFLARGRMDRDERALADRLLARPTEKGVDPYASYEPGAERGRVCSSQFPICVTYVRTSKDRTTDGWALRTLQTFEESWRVVVDSLGYPPPAPDGTAGGDSRFDVYLADVSTNGLYGYCAPEASVPGEPSVAQSYCVLDNDMAGFVMDPQSSLAVTAAHEFFHAIQFAMDAGEDLWFMEASATWMEEQVADRINDNRQFLPSGQLGLPQVPLDSYSSDMAMYGNWIFVQYLSQRYGTDAVRKVWERLSSRRGSPDEWSLRGIDSFLRARNSSWPAFYSRFVEANLTPGRSYDEGGAYRKAQVKERRLLRPGRRSRWRTPVAHLSSHSVVLRPAPAPRGRQRVRVRVVARKGKAAPAATLLVHRRSGKVNRLPVRLNRKGVGTRTVNFAPRQVRRVVVVTSNASLRYRRCGRGTTWACGGTPRDDDQVFTVTARVRR